MTDVPITIAVVGAGLIGPRHAEAIRNCPSAHLLAFVDPDPAARTVAASFDVPFFQSISELLASSETRPDAAIICTPNHTHVSIARDFLAAGIHVLVEKPLCTEVTEGRALIQFAEVRDLKLLVGHHRRFNPYVVAAKRALEAGVVGKVIAISGLWTLKKADAYFLSPTAWKRVLKAEA